MTTIEKLSLERDNTNRMICLREGMFWHLYERSAYLFVKQIKAYKTTRRYVKAAGEDIVYLGLPEDALETVFSGYEFLVRTASRVEVKSPLAVDLEAFRQWKEGVSPANPAVVRETPPRFSGIETAVRDFDLVNSTPMDCMQFVSRLKLLLAARQ
ncbi:MAG: hypothetical protein IJQ61_11875 [Bacteroidales bacterium]|nr:hypothetical protein [Bacteroidales bacterium]